MDTRHWRNIVCDESGPDAEMERIDALREELGPESEPARHVRALISRFDSITHYRAHDNLALLLDAVAALDYAGRPAVDVLHRVWEADDERRREFLGISRGLRAWGDGLSREEALARFPRFGEAANRVYDVLGDAGADGDRRWLVLSLAKTIADFAESPEDELDALDDEGFVCGVYRLVLDREPSPDDLATRLKELADGKPRDGFMREILESGESVARKMQELAHGAVA